MSEKKPKYMTKADINKKAMLEALEKSLGVVTTACKSVGISRETHYKYYREDEDYKAKVDGVEDIAIDFAESQLHKQIKEGSTAASIFYLKTKGKKRGYIETQHQVLDVPTGDIHFSIEGEEPEEK